MTALTIHSETHSLIKPEPRVPISIRVATMDGGRDYEFIDDLQKKHGKMVGFAKRGQLLAHIEQQTALIAEEGIGRPIGYCLYQDRYMKREDCGYIVQLNVAPNKHRGLVGAALIQDVFSRVPYSVKLFCCWCAQDLEANHFWEAIGFVPLAFRSGSRGKAHGGSGGRKETRLHIFWQRRVRENDDSTPYWFPSQTTNGPMQEARIVLPIPPGTHWSDPKPMVLPGAPVGEPATDRASLPEGQGEKPKRTRAPASPRKPQRIIANPKSITQGGLWFAPPAPPKPAALSPEEKAAARKAQREANRLPKQPPRKNDPKYIAAARELAARYLEQVNSGMLLPPSAHGKYDVSRQLEASTTEVKQALLLDAA